MNMLSSLILLPIFGFISHLFIGSEEKDLSKHRWISLIFSFATFIYSLVIASEFNEMDSHMQFQANLWLDTPMLGMDGISLSFILLTTFLVPLCFLGSWNIASRYKLYSCCFLMLEAIVLGIFLVQDMLLFYILFEASLIPMFMIIGIWGGDNRIYASFKFFLYTLAGSLLFLISIIYMYNQFNTMDIQLVTTMARYLPLEVQKMLWIGMFLSFCIKIPMFPFHTWLPDAHVQAPTGGSVILAGILLKLGGYGFMRFSIPMLPLASAEYSNFVALLSVIAIIYGSMVAFAQKDMKKMIAYSSIAHMGYVTIGLFSNNAVGINGAMFQMLSHGIISGALFLVVGSFYDRMHTKEIAKYGGVASVMPLLAGCFMIFTMSSVGLPGTSGFVGEFLVIVGSFKGYNIFGVLVASGAVFGAIYMLYLYAKVMFGAIDNEEVKVLKDIGIREGLMFVPLVLLTIYFGIVPSTITDLFKLNVLDLIR